MFSVLFGDNSTLLIQKLLVCYSGSLQRKLVQFSFCCSERESSLRKLKRKIIFFKKPLISSKQKMAQGVLCGLLLGFLAFIVVAWIQSLVKALRSYKLSSMLKTNKQHKPPSPKKALKKKVYCEGQNTVINHGGHDHFCVLRPPCAYPVLIIQEALHYY